MDDSLIIIGGATGVGKTELSLSLAEKIGGEIISADSMQVYRGFDIGTAKIREDEKRGIPHHLIDILDADGQFSVFEFKKLAMDAVSQIRSAGHIPIIVGGTGFYIQSVLYDISFDDEGPDTSYRKILEDKAIKEGPAVLHDMLKDVDCESALLIHPNNVKKVIRALEFYHETGEKISGHNKEQRSKESPFNFAYFVLNRERAAIYDRINKRVDKMIEQGLEEEIRNLLESGVSENSLAMQGLGYKEMLPYINGLSPFSDCIVTLKLNTRHFAKRQLTWFKRENDAIWLNYEDYSSADEMLEFMINTLKEKKIV